MTQLRTKSLYPTIDQRSELARDVGVAYCRMGMALHTKKAKDEMENPRNISRIVPNIF